MAEQPQVEHLSGFEPWLIERICQPILRRIPRNVHPNTISLTNTAVAWLCAGAAGISSTLTWPWQSVALVLAGLLMFVTMVADNLDGMQARRTDRCSKLGELADHGLDAIHVPLVTLGLSLALGLAPWAMVLVHLTNAMIYNGQFILFHQSGAFIHTETSGSDAQFGVSLGYLALALLFVLTDSRHPWVTVGVNALAAIAVLVQLKLNIFYYRRIGRNSLIQLPFILYCTGFAALYLLGAFNSVAFLLAVVFVSFRITGGLVLATLLKRPFSGQDHSIAVWLVATAALHVGAPQLTVASLPLSELCPYLAMTTMVARALAEFSRTYPAIVPKRA